MAKKKKPKRPAVLLDEISPESFRSRHLKIVLLRDEAEQLLGRLIRDCGWTNTNEHYPRAFWKWEKQIGNTILIADTAETALKLQDRLISEASECA